MSKYILSIDQSTQGTKALLFDERGALLCRADRPHRQIIDDRGWVEHDPEEIMRNTLQVAKDVVEKAGVDKADILIAATAGDEVNMLCCLIGKLSLELIGFLLKIYSCEKFLDRLSTHTYTGLLSGIVCSVLSLFVFVL